jgi:hypothetical protein
VRPENNSNISAGMIMSPTATNKRYNREKYYSALKTGFKHADTKLRESFLRPPELKMDEPLFPIFGLG